MRFSLLALLIAFSQGQTSLTGRRPADGCTICRSEGPVSGEDVCRRRGRGNLLQDVCSSPQSSSVTIRVGLIRRLGHAKQVFVQAAELGRLIGGKAEETGGSWRILRSGDGVVAERVGGESAKPIRAEAIRFLSGMDGPIGVSAADPDPDSKPRILSSRGRRVRQAAFPQYRGEIEVCADPAGGLRVVNVVELEEYLRGVVPVEMDSTAPLEALKAQAVAARTYALKSRGKHAKQGYDLTDTTSSQAYGGLSAASPATDRAVEATRGMVLTHNGALILADYYDDCGGVTAPGDNADDYPPSVIDAPPNGEPYCSAGRGHRWELALDAAELVRILRGTRGIVSTSKIRDVSAVATDDSSRVGRVRFELAGGKPVEVRAASLRALLGYDRLKSTRFTVAKDGDRFTFTGTGYGHGRGMCQSGAVGMASAPYRYDFRQILEHYFPGSEIVRWGDESR